MNNQISHTEEENNVFLLTKRNCHRLAEKEILGVFETEFLAKKAILDFEKSFCEDKNIINTVYWIAKEKEKYRAYHRYYYKKSYSEGRSNVLYKIEYLKKNEIHYI